mgnify:CR=1 FL=1
MSFTVQNVEFYLLVLLRISAFVMTAPFFSYSTIPHQLKAALSIMLTLIVLNTIPVVSLSGSIWIFGTRPKRDCDRTDLGIYVQYVHVYHQFCRSDDGYGDGTGDVQHV